MPNRLNESDEEVLSKWESEKAAKHPINKKQASTDYPNVPQKDLRSQN